MKLGGIAHAKEVVGKLALKGKARFVPGLCEEGEEKEGR